MYNNNEMVRANIWPTLIYYDRFAIVLEVKSISLDEKFDLVFDAVVAATAPMVDRLLASCRMDDRAKL